MDDSFSFGQWLKRRRKTLDLTQDELAQHVGYSLSAIRKVEANEVRASKPLSEKLADALKIAPVEREVFLRFARDQGDAALALALLTPAQPEQASVSHRLVPTPPEPQPIPTNLPVSLIQLIDREQEFPAVCALLQQPEVRVVTLTGPGGTGKTRLALQVATTLFEQFTDGVFLISLAPLTDPHLVISSIAHTLDIRQTSARPLVDWLKEYMRARQMLLVLDNFEHVVAAAPLVADLLAHTSRVKVLITSRLPLRVQGEREYPIPPLPVVDPTRLPSLADLNHFGAVALFIQRARDVKPDFQLTPANAPAVAEICQRLDGLPLAIELAAARSKVLSPQALLARLERRLPLLTGGRRDAPSRQQTLRNTIEWSYNLLAPDEQTMFRRLSVFAGGCTVASAAAILQADADWGADTLDTLTSLVDKSLMNRTEDAQGEPRFWMLQTIQEYGIERLEASGDFPSVWQRYTQYCLTLAEQAEPSLRGSHMTEWLTRLDQEHNNLRAVLAWCQAHQQGELGQRLAGALYWFWRTRGLFSEGRQWLEDMLALPDATHSMGIRAKVLCSIGGMAQFQGDFEIARTRLEESHALFEATDDRGGIAFALYNLGQVALAQHAYTEAYDFGSRSVQLFREAKDDWGLALALQGLGIVTSARGNDVAARFIHLESLALFRACGDQWGISLALSGLGRVAYAQGNYPAAQALFQASLTIRRAIGDQWLIAVSLHLLGKAVGRQGEAMAAVSLYQESLALFYKLGDKPGSIRCLESLAETWVSQGQPQTAAYLIGAADGLRATLKTPRSPFEQADYEQICTAVHASLTDTTFIATTLKGQSLSLDQAVKYGLETAHPTDID